MVRLGLLCAHVVVVLAGACVVNKRRLVLLVQTIGAQHVKVGGIYAPIVGLHIALVKLYQYVSICHCSYPLGLQYYAIALLPVRYIIAPFTMVACGTCAYVVAVKRKVTVLVLRLKLMAVVVV